MSILFWPRRAPPRRGQSFLTLVFVAEQSSDHVSCCVDIRTLNVERVRDLLEPRLEFIEPLFEFSARFAHEVPLHAVPVHGSVSEARSGRSDRDASVWRATPRSRMARTSRGGGHAGRGSPRVR